MLYHVDLQNATIGDPIPVCKTGAPGEWDTVGIEAPCVVKRHGLYFHWYSSWTDVDYYAGYLTATDFRGPWKKNPANPVIRENESWIRPGHNNAFRGLDGKDYVIFHAESKLEDTRIERMFIRPIVYHPDGTVTIG